MKFDQNTPLYLQIMLDIKQSIITGEYPSGSRMDTVRNLAIHYGVNPNTVQRALSELEREQLVYTERTNGRFISEDEERIHQVQSEFANRITDTFISEMRRIHMQDEEMIEKLKGRLMYGK